MHKCKMRSFKSVVIYIMILKYIVNNLLHIYIFPLFQGGAVLHSSYINFITNILSVLYILVQTFLDSFFVITVALVCDVFIPNSVLSFSL